MSSDGNAAYYQHHYVVKLPTNYIVDILYISNMNIYCCYLHKVNKLVEHKNEPRDLIPNVNKGKQVC